MHLFSPHSSTFSHNYHFSLFPSPQVSLFVCSFRVRLLGNFAINFVVCRLFVLEEKYIQKNDIWLAWANGTSERDYSNRQFRDFNCYFPPTSGSCPMSCSNSPDNWAFSIWSTTWKCVLTRMFINEGRFPGHNDCKVLVGVAKALYHIDFRPILILNYFVPALFPCLWSMIINNSVTCWIMSRLCLFVNEYARVVLHSKIIQPTFSSLLLPNSSLGALYRFGLK